MTGDAKSSQVLKVWVRYFLQVVYLKKVAILQTTVLAFKTVP